MISSASASIPAGTPSMPASSLHSARNRDPSTRAAGSLGLASTHCLDRRARHRAIGAEHATISLLRTQCRAAAGTFVKELAGIGRHGFRFGGSATRAGDNGFKDHGSSSSV
jgi:hypothetical protein